MAIAGGVIENRDRYRLAVDYPGQTHPRTASAPDGLSIRAIAAEIAAGHAGIVQTRHRLLLAVGTDEHLGLLRWML